MGSSGIMTPDEMDYVSVVDRYPRARRRAGNYLDRSTDCSAPIDLCVPDGTRIDPDDVSLACRIRHDFG